jgi:hypothetical protein
MAIQLISIGTSEADCERGLSIQWNILQADGTTSKTVSLAARLCRHEVSTSVPGKQR